MRTSVNLDASKPIDVVTDRVRTAVDAGLSGIWLAQVFGYDALTLLSVIGTRVPDVDLGTAVVPVYGRHPQVMAQQALTVQAIVGNRLTLGVGLSHQTVVESMWGLSFERPAHYMAEYLAALMPMVHGQTVDARGDLITAATRGPLEVPGAEPPAVLVAALGPVMLGVAGRMADGTVTWMTGIRTVGRHVTPRITAAARQAGRPAPRVVVGLPVTVTDDPDSARERIDRSFGFYLGLPSYKAMLDMEGATRPSDVALVGSEDRIVELVGELHEAGATELVASVAGSPEERTRSLALLGSINTG
jgi:F420-dependent oxidoreductase-like protein